MRLILLTSDIDVPDLMHHAGVMYPEEAKAAST
jgi:hypothetical protein